MFGPLMHTVKWLQAESVIYDHCTSTVKRKLIKVNCSDIYGNFYVLRPGRFLALTHIIARCHSIGFTTAFVR